MDNYISREKTIEAIKTDLSQFVYDEYGNMTALGVRLIYRIGSITGVEPFGNLIDRDELVKDIKGQTERDGKTLSDVISKDVLEVFLDYIRNFPSARPVDEMTDELKGKEALEMAIKALEAPPNDNWEGYSKRLWKSAYERGKAEQTIALDKIRTEIIQMPTISFNVNDIYKADVLAIIDKYKAESEDKQ